MIEKLKILIIEDEEYNRTFYQQILSERWETVDVASTLAEGDIKSKQLKPDLVLLDLKFDRDESREGLEFLQKLKRECPDIEVIVISGSRRDSTKIEAVIKYGAYDYLEKPVRRDVLLMVVHRVMERIRLNGENIRLKQNLARARKFEGFFGMLGHSSPMKAVFEKIKKIARYDNTVLITGDTGTGKELVARAIHKLSGRSPLIAIDLGTISEELAGSELFGHEKGAFTGAVAERKGKIEAVADGTVFLDEIENISLDVQQKLLRLLEQKSYQRVGSNITKTTEARFLVATNVDLKDYVNKGHFREDLYHRLNVVNIRLPSLKERQDDIPLLANYFLHIHCKSLDLDKSFIPETLTLLKEYSWPGNVRELKHCIEEALIFGLDEHYLLPEDFKFEPKKSKTEKENDKRPVAVNTLKQVETEAKRGVILKALNQTNGVIAKAARILDITPRHLRRLMDEYTISDGTN